jgi:hypothetical protein
MGGTPAIGGGGSGGMSGGAGMGSGGAPPFSCDGCARLLVPLDESGDYTHFTKVLSSATDLGAATLTFSVAREAGTGGTFRGYVQQGEGQSFAYHIGPSTKISDIPTNTTLDVVWDLTSETTFDVTAIERIGIEITAEGSTSWADPTVILVDRIAVAGATPAVAASTFDDTSSVYTTPVEIYDPGPLWLNSYSADTTATGSEISWIGP